MSMQMGELAIVVDGQQVYSHKQAGDRIPSDAELLEKVTSRK
jgi:hypothetical protein